MRQLLDNIFWHSFSGPHRRFAVGTDQAMRMAPGFSPILAFPEANAPDFDALRACCETGERFYTDGWSGPEQASWPILFESTMLKMIWEGGVLKDVAEPEAVPLNKAHAGQALALAKLTNPGPFGLRTLELGEYFGFFEGGQLMAMAGERVFAGTLREISGVCTHPDFQGRGYARRLMNLLIRREMQRNETPVLHVMSKNTGAVHLYRKMGFAEYRESVVRVVSPA